MRIDEELLQKAHDLGLNVTKVCENALKEMIRRIETPSATKTPKDCPEDATNDHMVGLPGFEPESREPKSHS